jgi:hypothetical protein
MHIALLAGRLLRIQLVTAIPDSNSRGEMAMAEREWKDNRDNQMIEKAISEMQGKVIKGTITKANAGGKNNWYNNVEKIIPAATGDQWYVKMDVGGMPGYASQKGRGTPRVIVLVDGTAPQNVAWFTDHYNNFFTLKAKEFFNDTSGLRAYYSK